MSRPGLQNVLVSGSLEQSRVALRCARDFLEPIGGVQLPGQFDAIGNTAQGVW